MGILLNCGKWPDQDIRPYLERRVALELVEHGHEEVHDDDGGGEDHNSQQGELGAIEIHLRRDGQHSDSRHVARHR